MYLYRSSLDQDMTVSAIEDVSVWSDPPKQRPDIESTSSSSSSSIPIAAPSPTLRLTMATSPSAHFNNLMGKVLAEPPKNSSSIHLKRPLLPPPLPNPSGLERTLIHPAPPHSHWTARPTIITLDGQSYSLAHGDWIVRVLALTATAREDRGGGTNPNQMEGKGIVVEVEYTPVPYLPPNSELLQEFMKLIFPPGAEWYMVEPPERTRSNGASTEKEKPKTEWTVHDTVACYIAFLRKEGII